MSNKKTDKNPSETTLDELQDEQLDNVQGGLKYKLDDVFIKSYSTGGSAEFNADDKPTRKLTSGD